MALYSVVAPFKANSSLSLIVAWLYQMAELLVNFSRVYAHVCDQSLILKSTCWQEINLNQMLFADSFYLLIILVNLDALHKETLKKLLKAYQQLTFKASFH